MRKIIFDNDAVSYKDIDNNAVILVIRDNQAYVRAVLHTPKVTINFRNDCSLSYLRGFNVNNIPGLVEGEYKDLHFVEAFLFDNEMEALTYLVERKEDIFG